MTDARHSPSPSAAGGVPARRMHEGLVTALLVLVVAAVLAGAVFPLRHYVVEPRRQALLGLSEPPGRRLALASVFAFETAAGATVRMVPGRPALELSDLPAQAVTLVLGGFRGPYVVWLWIRVEEEKHRKIHFDLIDRYTKIATLQSDYPQMWVYHAWNLAWNVSVQWQSLERKYQWIRRAIEFLTEGYRKNPHSAEIMAEMGRIYSEKLGRSQEAEYYRKRVREETGRSTFLIAYEWYDRARQADEIYQSRGRGLSQPVLFSQPCHNLSYYAKETGQAMYDAFKASVEAAVAGRAEETRRAYEEGLAHLDEVIRAWEAAHREWEQHTLRFEKEDAPPTLLSVYRRFTLESAGELARHKALQSELTQENLPVHFAKMTRPEIE